MTFKQFFTSTGGKFATGTLSFALAAAGALALLGPGRHVHWIVSIATMLTAAGFIAAVGLSLERFQSISIALLLLLPLLGGLYFVTLREVVRAGPGIGLLLLVAGYVLALLTESGFKVLSRPKEKEPEPPSAPAHH